MCKASCLVLIFACLQVKYNERFVEELHLPVEKIASGSAKPQPFAAETIAASSWPPVARPVLQQEPQATATQDTFQVSNTDSQSLFYV